MKKLQYILMAVAVCVGLGSCTDNFLDTKSKVKLTDDNFYKTVSDMEMALVGCYDGYQRTVSDGGLSIYVVSEVMSDDCFGGTGAQDSRDYQALDRFDISQSPSSNDLWEQTWISYYAGIFRCNELLQKMGDPASWGTDEATVNRIAGEAHFLRALMYFDMVRLFERIPLLTEPTSDNVPQSEPADTYKLIASDLQFAVDNIPADAYPKSDAADNDGRATRYAAESLLARVYLFYTGYYGADDLGVTKDEVLQGLEDVISNGGFALVPEYKDLWRASSYVPGPDNTLDKSAYAGAGNSEVVFAQKFNNTSDYNGMVDGNRWLVMMGMRQLDFSPYGKGWGAAPVDPSLVNAFDAADLRKTASVIDVAGEGIDQSDLFDTSVKDQREYTGYWEKKYQPTSLPDGTIDVGGGKDMQLSWDQDYIVIRYADVLLMAAELGSANAQSYLDEVRSRAGLGSEAVSEQNILNERRFEFAFEGIRYWDLLRQGLQTAASTIAQTADVLSGNAPDQVVIDAANITKTRGFQQIPTTQITLSDGVMTQNAGW